MWAGNAELLSIMPYCFSQPTQYFWNLLRVSCMLKEILIQLLKGLITLKIYVDADACPVKDIIIEEATNRNLEVVLVTSISHFSLQAYPPGVETIYVDNGNEAADYRIIQLAKKGDFIITQDYGLASLALGKKCLVMHHKGFMYTNKNIDQMLQTRYLSAQARKAGNRTKGPKAFTNEDKETFRQKFIQAIEKRESKQDE